MTSSAWNDFLAASGAHYDHDIVTGFGPADAEFRAAREAAVIAPLDHLGLIECAGDDAQDYLHNQLTSDVRHLEADAAQHAAWCTAKGRMQASFLLYRSGPVYRALLSADLIEPTLKRLQIFVLRSKVKLADLSASQQAIGVAGPHAAAALGSAGLPVPTAALKSAEFDGGVVIALEATRFIVVASTGIAPTLWGKLAAHAQPAGTPIWHWLDVQAGLPLITAATKEEFVPQMANFDKIGGVSFHKGCYPGQEIVARAQYLGKVKRHLYRIHADSPIAAGMPIFSPENAELPCGMVANAAPSPEGGFDALAVIQESFVDAGALQLGAGGPPLVAVEAVAGVA